MITIYDNDLPITVAQKLITGAKLRSHLDMFSQEDLEEIVNHLLIHDSHHGGEYHLNNAVQQKHSYECGYEHGVEDGGMLVTRNVITSLKEIQRGFGTLEEFIDQLETSIKKEVEE